MLKEYLVVDFVQTEATSQILPREPLISSHQASWNCMQLGYHRQPACETPEHLSSHHVISISLGQSTVKERMIDRYYQRHCFVNGDISITPANTIRKVRLEQEAEFIHLYPDPAFFAQTICELVDLEKVEIATQFKIRDPLIQGIGLALKAELESGCLGGRLYVESAASLLAVHLIQRYSTQQLANLNCVGGLSQSKLQQAIEYINNYLVEDVSLQAIAQHVNISRYHFARLFKQSTGLTPHQYVTQCRLNAAKQMLAEQKLSIAEISCRLGFSHQGQFATFFRKYVGISPTLYRQKL